MSEVHSRAHRAPRPSETRITAHGDGPGRYDLQIAPRIPAVAMLCSMFVPGLGSVTNSEAGKGLALLFCFVSSAYILLAVSASIGAFGVFVFWAWAMFDAYQGARDWNARHGIIS